MLPLTVRIYGYVHNFSFTLTDYLAQLVREDAPKTLKRYCEIQLTNQQFDNFRAICEAEHEPSQAIKEAAKRLDDEGF